MAAHSHQACDLDDATARLTVAVKLALLLEDGGGSPSDPSQQLVELSEARDVLVAAVRVAERFRCELMSANHGAADEHLRWITASRSQPSEELASLVGGGLKIPPLFKAVKRECLMLAQKHALLKF